MLASASANNWLKPIAVVCTSFRIAMRASGMTTKVPSAALPEAVVPPPVGSVLGAVRLNFMAYLVPFSALAVLSTSNCVRRAAEQYQCPLPVGSTSASLLSRDDSMLILQ